MLLYACPDIQIKSAGIRIIYRHVALLVKHGFRAAVLHQKVGFSLHDMPNVPIRYLTSPRGIAEGDTVVIPEGMATLMSILKDHPVRRFVIAMNWKYPYHSLPDDMDWRDFKIERILALSEQIADFVHWTMQLPTHVFQWGIKSEFYYDSDPKKPQIVFIPRKCPELRELKGVLRSRSRQLIDAIDWRALDGLSEADYAQEIRRASIFLTMSHAEGLPCSALEAMRAGTLVAGYNSVGGQRQLIGTGEKQNCILAENLDYPTLARLLEPVLSDVLDKDMSHWEQIRRSAMALSRCYTPEEEEASLLKMWSDIGDEGSAMDEGDRPS